jgi:hypothetical protein
MTRRLSGMGWAAKEMKELLSSMTVASAAFWLGEKASDFSVQVCEGPTW